MAVGALHVPLREQLPDNKSQFVEGGNILASGLRRCSRHIKMTQP